MAVQIKTIREFDKNSEKKIYRRTEKVEDIYVQFILAPSIRAKR